MRTEPSSWTSRNGRSLGAALVVLLFGALLPGSAPAGEDLPYYGPPPPRETRPLSLVDPIDGHSFEWNVSLASNALGGYDSDGCTYAKGEQARTNGVATSPTSLYSARAESFNRTLTDEQKQSLLVMLSSVGADVEDARKLAPSERYAMAAAVAEHLADPPFDVAELYLMGAWTVRDTIVGFLPGVRGAGDAWNKLEEVAALAKAVEEPGPRTRALFDLARLAHRGGFVHERDDYLGKLDGFPDAGIGGLEKRTEFFKRADREAMLLAKARRWYLKGLDARDGDESDRAVARLMVAELSRRLGEFDEAHTHVEALRLDTAAPAEVTMQAEDVAQALRVQAQKAFAEEGSK